VRHVGLVVISELPCGDSVSPSLLSRRSSGSPGRCLTMRVFRTVVFTAVLAVACGGRTSYDDVGSGASGSSSGSMGSASSDAAGDQKGDSGGGRLSSGTVVASGGVSAGGTLVYPGDACGVTIICPTGQRCRSGVCAPEPDAADGSDRMAGGVGEDDGSCVVCFDDADAVADSPPSCAPGGPGMTNCGPGGSGTESCCTSLEVTGGTFYRTYDLTDAGVANPPPDGGPTGEADPATVSSFRLDKYLVTVGRFRQFANAVLPPDGGAGWLPAVGSGKHTHLNGGMGLANASEADAGVAYEMGWSSAMVENDEATETITDLTCGPYSTWTATAGSQEDFPINCVNWWQAYAFCIWDGGFLPSEAEWEYAAAGANQQREYPWGSTPPGTASQYAIYNVGTVAPVGTATLGAGLWGQLDLAGEVWEWNLDSYAATYADPCVDCANLTGTSTTNFRANRGGDIYSPAWYLVPSYRGDGNSPADRNYAIGFRCARTP
jgi:sulfatase modifying factor 1